MIGYHPGEIEVYEEYLEYLEKIKKRSRGTLKEYRSILREFTRFPLNADGFREYLDAISKNAPRTQRLKLSVVKGYLEWLHDRGKIPERFWGEVEPPKITSLPHYLTRDEIERFFNVIDDDYYRGIFRLLINSGMRISELLNLRREDVQISKDVARIRIRGKGSKERIVQISKEIVEEVERVGFFKRRVSARTLQRKMKEYLKRAGINRRLTPHSLRHTFAIILMENGIPLNRIQALLGHESITTTSVYLKIVGEGEKLPKII